MSVRAVGAVYVLRAGAGVISSELLEMQMRNFVIIRRGLQLFVFTWQNESCIV